MFSKVFVINLTFKTDRLEAFRKSYPSCLPPFEVWPAVHGDSIRHPDWWRSGAGAWGCYRSHLQILEKCYQDRLDSYLVLEDDAIFRSDFEAESTKFFYELPTDWEQIYLGGQLLHEHQHPPQRISDNVYRPYNVNRTHALAVSQRGYERIYKHLNATPFRNGEHIDHHWGRLHESGRLKIYCPGKWLVGQDGGPSNISGNNNAATFWVDPEKLASDNHDWRGRVVPAVFLEAPIAVAIELERRGWHRGHWQNADRLDIGICNAIASGDVKEGLIRWYQAVMPEAVREGKKCIAMHHPLLTWEQARSIEQPISRLVADSTEDAERQLERLMQSSGTAKPTESRNLIYHIWPRRGYGVWQWNIEQLLQRIEQFNGIRTIAIVTDEESDSVEDVKTAFGGARIDHWIHFRNDPERGETVTLKAMLETLPKDQGITFYAHAKGVKYSGENSNRPWSQMMYEVCLDDTLFVDAALEQSATAGPFLRDQPGWMRNRPTSWHYSGTFFWFRNKEIFAHPEWQNVQPWYYGVEHWLGQFIPREQAYCLFGNDCGDVWRPEEYTRLREELDRWKSARRSACRVGD